MHGSYGYGLQQVDKSNRGAHGFKTVEDLAAWKKEEFEWKLSAEKRLGRKKIIFLLSFFHRHPVIPPEVWCLDV